MLSVKIICVGSVKEKYFKDAAGEYMKRLSPFCRLTIIEINEAKLRKASKGDVNTALQKEGRDIMRHLDAGYVAALCIEGKPMASEQFSKVISNLSLKGYNKINFIIGGSYGLCDKVKTEADLKLSFSPMTFPHQLTRVILLEQIYRAFSIAANGKYHK